MQGSLSMSQSDPVYMRFLEDRNGARYVKLTDLMDALRRKMVGSAAGTFCDQFAAELYEAAEKAFTEKAKPEKLEKPKRIKPEFPGNAECECGHPKYLHEQLHGYKPYGHCNYQHDLCDCRKFVLKGTNT